MIRRCGVVDFIPPINIRIIRRIFPASERIQFVGIVTKRKSVIRKRLVERTGIGESIGKFRCAKLRADTVLIADTHFQLAGRSPPRGDHHDPVRTAHTVERNRCGVLQHDDRFDLLYRKILKIPRETVDKYQRSLSVNRQRGDVIGRRADSLINIQSGDSSVKGFGRINLRRIVQHFAAHSRRCPGAPIPVDTDPVAETYGIGSTRDRETFVLPGGGRQQTPRKQQYYNGIFHIL